MTLAPHSVRRNGLSLLEVLIALAVFLVSLVGIGRLVILGSDQALQVQDQLRASQLCQAKLAELMAGAIPLSSQNEAPFDEAPDWNWSVECNQGDVSGLWNVTLHVTHQSPTGVKVDVVVSQMIVDPSLRGSAMDVIASTASSTTDTGTSGTDPSSSQPGGGGTMPSNSTQQPQAMAVGGATTPGKGAGAGGTKTSAPTGGTRTGGTGGTRGGTGGSTGGTGGTRGGTGGSTGGTGGNSGGTGGTRGGTGGTGGNSGGTGGNSGGTGGPRGGGPSR